MGPDQDPRSMRRRQDRLYALRKGRPEEPSRLPSDTRDDRFQRDWQKRLEELPPKEAERAKARQARLEALAKTALADREAAKDTRRDKLFPRNTKHPGDLPESNSAVTLLRQKIQRLLRG